MYAVLIAGYFLQTGCVNEKQLLSKSEVQKFFGTKLKQLRREKKLSQNVLAELADLDIRSIQRIEAGEFNISLYNVYKLAHVLNVTPTTFFPD